MTAADIIAAQLARRLEAVQRDAQMMRHARLSGEGSLSRPVLIVDEAQEMSSSVLAELRLLSSTRLDSQILLTVVLAGDRRLVERFRSDEFLPLGSRMRVRLALDRAKPDELRDCLHFSLLRMSVFVCRRGLAAIKRGNRMQPLQGVVYVASPWQGVSDKSRRAADACRIFACALRSSKAS